MEEQNVLRNYQEKEPFNFMDFLQFKRMVTLQVIPVFYAIIAGIITLGGLIMMFSGGSRRGYGDYGSGFFSFFQGGFIGGLLFIILGNLFWRMWCEFILVLFRVNKNLQDIEKNTRV